MPDLSPPAMELSQQTKATVKATVPVMLTHGTAIIQEFYKTLFTRYPCVKRQFNTDRVLARDGTPVQVSALAKVVILFASKVDNLESVLPLLRPIGEKHVSRGVSAAQYDAVGECLLMAMKQVLGDGVSDEVLGAWGEAYTFLKDTFIAMENEIRESNEKRAGWSGVKEVTVKALGVIDGDRTLKFDVSVPDSNPGMFISVGVKYRGEETMASVKIVETGNDGLTVLLRENMERATKALFELKEGDRVCISVPCGR